MSEEKAKYRILRLSFIGNQLLDEGAEVEYDGTPGSALEPLNEAAQKAKAATGKSAVVEVPKPDAVNDGTPGSGGDIDKLRDEYEALFKEKPHHNTKAETLREKIDAERQRLGV